MPDVLQGYEGYCERCQRVYCSPVSVDEECTVSFTSDPLSEQDLKLIFSATEMDLPSNCIYKTTIETVHIAGSTNSTGNLFISKVYGHIINPRCACAARVTVVAMCICLCVCQLPL